MPGDDSVLQYLDGQLDWYDARGSANRRMYQRLKIAVVFAAALIPFVSAISAIPVQVAGALGVLIVVLEQIQQMNQNSANWISYRAIAEKLRRERLLYSARAGVYAAASDPAALLAERMDEATSREQAQWLSNREKAQKADPAVKAP